MINDWHAALDRRVAAGELAPAPRSAYTIGAAKFFNWALPQPIATVSRETLQDWIAALRTVSHKPGSINTWLSGLRAFYAWALTERRLASDPTAGLNGTKRKRTPCKPAALDEVAMSIAMVHAELLLIHPFRDGNGRLARWLVDIMGYPSGLSCACL